MSKTLPYRFGEMLANAATVAALVSLASCSTTGERLSPDEAYARLSAAYCTVPAAERAAFRAKYHLPHVITCSSDLPGAAPIAPQF